MLFDPQDCVLGYDLGVKTGSLVQVKVCSKYHFVEDYKVLCSYTKGPKIKDPSNVIMTFFHRHVFCWLRPEFAEWIAVDWNRNEVHFGPNKSASNVKTFIAGYLSGIAHQSGLDVSFIAPKDIRQFFGLKGNANKNDVHREFLSLPLVSNGVINYRTDHDLDAVILGYILKLRLLGVANINTIR